MKRNNPLIQLLQLMFSKVCDYNFDCNKTYWFFSSGIPEIQIFYTEYHVYFGSAITLDCQVSANPAHTTVQWKKIVDEYQSIIVPNDTYSGSTLSTPALTIFNADLGDEGYYICTASNSLGTGQSVQVYLDVIGSKIFF